MQFDRRITNGLAWTGALLVVAIPAADFALRQFGPAAAPQVAVIQETPEPAPAEPASALPTPVAERPAPTPEKPEVSAPIAEVPAPAEADTPAPEAPAEPDVKAAPVEADPIVTANTSRRVSGEQAVESYLQSGRALPSYISNGGSTAATEEAAPAGTDPAPRRPIIADRPGPEAPTPEEEQVAAVPPRLEVTMPTPVSERPPSVARAPRPAQPPLTIEEATRIITAQDLEEWESGPLSDFLAGRRSSGSQAPADYDPNGFFLDQGPNRRQGFPQAYELDYYPFE